MILPIMSVAGRIIEFFRTFYRLRNLFLETEIPLHIPQILVSILVFFIIIITCQQWQLLASISSIFNGFDFCQMIFIIYSKLYR